jgi:hypothetical protein
LIGERGIRGWLFQPGEQCAVFGQPAEVIEVRVALEPR